MKPLLTLALLTIAPPCLAQSCPPGFGAPLQPRPKADPNVLVVDPPDGGNVHIRENYSVSESLYNSAAASSPKWETSPQVARGIDKDLRDEHTYSTSARVNIDRRSGIVWVDGEDGKRTVFLDVKQVWTTPGPPKKTPSDAVDEMEAELGDRDIAALAEKVAGVLSKSEDKKPGARFQKGDTVNEKAEDGRKGGEVMGIHQHDGEACYAVLWDKSVDLHNAESDLEFGKRPKQ